MDSDFCRNCDRFKCVLLENTCRSKKMPPFRTVYMLLKCGKKILSSEPVGQAEPANEDCVVFCKPNSCASNYITKNYLSQQMLDDYDDALRRSFARIDSFSCTELPRNCKYMFEQEFCDMNKGFHP